MSKMEDELRKALKAVSAIESAFYRALALDVSDDLLVAEATLARLLSHTLDGEYDDVEL